MNPPYENLDAAINLTLPGDLAYFGTGAFTQDQITHMVVDTVPLAAALVRTMIPMGELAEAPCKIESKSTRLKTRNHSFDLARETTVQLTLAGISTATKDYLESTAFTGVEHTIALVSHALDRVTFFNGLRWDLSWSAETDGLFTLVISTSITGATENRVSNHSDIPTWVMPAGWTPADLQDTLVLIDANAPGNIVSAGLFVELKDMSGNNNDITPPTESERPGDDDWGIACGGDQYLPFDAGITPLSVVALFITSSGPASIMSSEQFYSRIKISEHGVEANVSGIAGIKSSDEIALGGPIMLSMSNGTGGYVRINSMAQTLSRIPNDNVLIVGEIVSKLGGSQADSTFEGYLLTFYANGGHLSPADAWKVETWIAARHLTED